MEFAVAILLINRKEEVAMSSNPHDEKVVHERVSLGGDARPSPRRSGATLARSGHVPVLGRSSSATAESAPKKARRAVRARIKSQPDEK
jgi:hypothetical protein